MFEEVKSRLLEDSQSICNILEAFDFAHISLRSREIRCGLEEGSNPSAIVIKLHNNDNLWVKDYTRNMSYDLINYIIKAKNVRFKEVINAIKKELGIENLYNYRRKTGLFGGLYDRVGKVSSEIEVNTYPEDVLEEYGYTPNLLWLQEGIGFETQRKWGIGYDVCSQRITLPIRAATGELMALKGRCNYEPDEDEPKYLYLIQGPMSQTLFGYSEQYSSLYENDILVFEAEKSVLKLDTWGYNNAVALGSNSLSPIQAKMLVSLNPKSVTFMLDKGLSLENNTLKNIEMLKKFCTMKEIKIRYWDWTDNITLNEKDAPCDDTLEEFKYILREEIKDEEELRKEDDDI